MYFSLHTTGAQVSEQETVSQDLSVPSLTAFVVFDIYISINIYIYIFDIYIYLRFDIYIYQMPQVC